MILLSASVVFIALNAPLLHGFSAFPSSSKRRSLARLQSAQPSDSADSYDEFFGSPDEVETTGYDSRDFVDKAKMALTEAVSAGLAEEDVRRLVGDLETSGSQAGVGGESTYSGLLAGEWELIYTSEDDITRSSPFFWAFRQAFPQESDQIFSITDSIPAPIKEVGPAYQTITIEDDSSGTFVSRVKVATLGGVATSIMTTRATVIAGDGRDGIKIRVDTTKPEESTILQKLGPLGDFIGSNSPPFPSGDSLEKVVKGSSEVVIRTTFCDENLRVSRNDARYNDIYVFKRKSFQGVFDV